MDLLPTRCLRCPRGIYPLLLAGILAAQALRAQPDLWIDGPNAVQPGSDRSFPAAAIDAWGRSIYVWEAFNGSVLRSDIYFRRFTPAGAPIENPTQVNTYDDDDQRYPRVAAATDGTFLVAWLSEEPGPDPNDPSGYWVRSQLFDATGAPSGSEQYVNTLDAAIGGGAVRVDVAALRDGGFVVVWRSAVGGTDTGISIQARLISAAGVPTGSPFQVNVVEPGSQEHCAVVGLADGGFAVVWTVPGVAIRKFAANGLPVTTQLDVNLSTTGFFADVASAPNGRVAVVWQEGGSVILGRLYDSSLNALGAEFAVSAGSDTDPDAPRVASYGGENFLVVWESFTGVGTDASSQSVQGRVIIGVDQFLGPQEQLNSFENLAQHQPGVGGSSYWLAIGWRSADNPDEPNDDAILGFGIDLCGGIFCDDFETGSTIRWTPAP